MAPTTYGEYGDCGGVGVRHPWIVRQPVFAVKAAHTGGTKASKADSQDAGRLSKVVLLAKGARVMLRRNLWTSVGPTNGAIGEFVSLIAPETGRMPFAALVRFPAYTGPALFNEDPKLVPVLPHTAHVSSKAGGVASLSRTQLPLGLAWATTIHKSQGQSYEKVAVNLGPKELQLGLKLSGQWAGRSGFGCRVC